MTVKQGLSFTNNAKLPKRNGTGGMPVSCSVFRPIKLHAGLYRAKMGCKGQRKSIKGAKL
jgi:hypothetical protein